jgi:hypothetical protein
MAFFMGLSPGSVIERRGTAGDMNCVATLVATGTAQMHRGLSCEFLSDIRAGGKSVLAGDQCATAIAVGDRNGACGTTIQTA